MSELRNIVRQILKEYVTFSDLKSVERYADDIFSDVGIDVGFTKHFLDRVNDPRNGKDITPEELEALYAKAREKYGNTLSKLPPGSERVVNDTKTDINVPVVIGWDGKSPNKDMTAKTVMRKKDFKTSFESPKLKLETPNENIDVPINVGDTVLGGKFKNKKIVVKQIDKNDKGDITINDKPLLRVRTIKENNINQSTVKCTNCDWEWEIEKNDKNPFLCHKCGYDNKEKKFDYKSLENWKEEESIKEGLWDNIHSKKERGESPTKPGDKDYPKKDAWEKAKNSSKNENFKQPEELNEDELIEAYDFLNKKNKFKSKDGNFELYETNEADNLNEAEYQGRKVKTGKIMRGDVKKFKVFVKNPKGNIVKVNFGDPNMRIKKSNPERRKSFRARFKCDNPGPKWKARYWACRTW